MTPWELAKTKSEHAEQRALFAWLNCAAQYGFHYANNEAGYKLEARELFRSLGHAYSPISELAFAFAIPNGGSRGDTAKARQIRGGQLKAEGVKPGVPDIMLPIIRNRNSFNDPIGRYFGLFIEMKRESRRTHTTAASSEQKAYHEFLISQGYKVVICFNWQEAAKVIQEYMS